MAICKTVGQASEAPSPSAAPGRAAAGRCVLDLWACVGHDPACAAALGRVLVADPGLVDALHDLPSAAAHFSKTLTGDHRGRADTSKELWRAMTTLVLESAERCLDAAASCRKAMPELVAACVAEPSCLRLVERFLTRRGTRGPEMLDMLLQLRAEALMAGKEPGGQLELRSMALDAFVAGRLADAERIYRHLIDHGGFEPAGTRTHLARVLILTGREPEAARLIEQAWPLGGQEPAYVEGRLLYLRSLLSALAGASTGLGTGDDALTSLSLLKGFVGRRPAHTEWTMAPVLEHVAPRLSIEQRELFAALLAVLSTGQGAERLEAMPAWRDMAAVPAGGPPNA